MSIDERRTAPNAAPSSAPRSGARGARRRRVSPLRLVAGTLAVWLLVALASTAWWPIHRDTAMVTAGVTAVVVGSVVALLGAGMRLPASVVSIATVVGFAATGVPAAVPGDRKSVV